MQASPLQKQNKMLRKAIFLGSFFIAIFNFTGISQVNFQPEREQLLAEFKAAGIVVTNVTADIKLNASIKPIFDLRPDYRPALLTYDNATKELLIEKVVNEKVDVVLQDLTGKELFKTSLAKKLHSSAVHLDKLKPGKYLLIVKADASQSGSTFKIECY